MPENNFPLYAASDATDPAGATSGSAAAPVEAGFSLSSGFAGEITPSSDHALSSLPEETATPVLFQENSLQILPGNTGSHPRRSRRTQEETDVLEAVRRLAPKAAEKAAAMLDDPWTPAAMKVKLIEIIFDRTFGKPNTSVKVTSVQETIEESREYLLALVQHVRKVDAP